MCTNTLVPGTVVVRCSCSSFSPPPHHHHLHCFTFFFNHSKRGLISSIPLVPTQQRVRSGHRRPGLRRRPPPATAFTAFARGHGTFIGPHVFGRQFLVSSFAATSRCTRRTALVGRGTTPVGRATLRLLCLVVEGHDTPNLRVFGGVACFARAWGSTTNALFRFAAGPFVATPPSVSFGFVFFAFVRFRQPAFDKGGAFRGKKVQPARQQKNVFVPLFRKHGRYVSTHAIVHVVKNNDVPVPVFVMIQFG